MANEIARFQAICDALVGGTATPAQVTRYGKAYARKYAARRHVTVDVDAASNAQVAYYAIEAMKTDAKATNEQYGATAFDARTSYETANAAAEAEGDADMPDGTAPPA